MSWMTIKMNDEQRTAMAMEIRPGVMASPWERGTCQHGKAFPFRWTWRPGRGETVVDGDPEGGCCCRKCST